MPLKPAARPVTPALPVARPASPAWLIVAVVALALMSAIQVVRAQRVLATTGLVAEPLVADPASPTGFAGGARELIVVEHNNDSYHWIAQTQQMWARGEWRVRHVDYDNAPFGRTVVAPSPYRWWLGGVAWVDHLLSGRPIGQSVERAALWADPLLQVLLLVLATAFVAWQFGYFSAAVLSTGIATLYPFAGVFIPGAPDDRSLSLVIALGSGLLLLAGAAKVVGANADSGGEPATGPANPGVRWFFFAGVASGLGVWVRVSDHVPLLGGIFLGGALAAWALRRAPAATAHALARAWRAWALGGAATVLLTSVVDFYPDQLASWQLRVTHPLYGLAWLGLGALLAQLTVAFREGRQAWSGRAGLLVVTALAAIAVIPLLMVKLKNDGFLSAGISALRLSKLPGGAIATNFWAWMVRDGVNAKVLTTLLPALLVVPAGWVLVRSSVSARGRGLAALALGPAAVAVGFGFAQLNGWSLAGGMLWVLLVGLTADRNGGKALPPRCARWSAAVALIAAAGLVQLLPPRSKEGAPVLTQLDLMGLIERDLARWLAQHATTPGALVIAPPKETTTLMYYGGLTGLGTLAVENVDGISAAVRVVSASTPEEAKVLVDRRGLNYFVMPTWDTHLDDYARIGMGQLEGTFLERLHLWRVPPWLRPVAYQLPTIAGFENESVKILQVVEEQEEAAALSRTAEYFIEMGQLDPAASIAQVLRRFPADLGALVARAQVEFARGDRAAFDKTIETLRPRLTGAGSRGLPWDRRVSLAVVLASAKQTELARAQVQLCLKDIDEAKIRALSSGSLYRLQVLTKAFGQKIPDERLQSLARSLVPADLRQRL